ncbi:hypothetical protein I316_07963 [Kwoniella heveanensis BCC8398]|uniref:Uncharacterized protein n=1 Tax=Kwoniella heveanensis BCC8398 TaxID=1296120 RepID=A0A1B9GHB8_9TREE|nr:hypothetical protein I316_07963 [Kwoniella heveanensis BCC8398]
MELTPENAAAGDKAYLNLLIWQTLESSAIGCLWSSVWGIAVQGVVMGMIGMRLLPLVQGRLAISRLQLCGVALGAGVVTAALGVSLDQTHRLIGSLQDYLSVLRIDQLENLVIVALAGVLGVSLMLHVVWRVWLSSRKILLITFLILLHLTTLGLTLSILVHGPAMPIPSVSKFRIFGRWVKMQGLLVQLWMGSMVAGLVLVWSSWVLCVAMKGRQGRGKDVRMICATMVPSTVIALIMLIYLCATGGSLDNASRAILQSLPAIFCLTILHLILENASPSEGGIKLCDSPYPVYSYTSPPPPSAYSYSRAGSSLHQRLTQNLVDHHQVQAQAQAQAQAQVRSQSRHTGRTNGTSRSGVSEDAGSVKVIVDKMVHKSPSLSHSISPPPSAWTFNRSRYTPSQASTPIPTPGFQAEVYPEVPLSVMAPFTDWDYDPNYWDADRDGDSVRTNIAPSFKSAVPSGKTLLIRSKSERSKKSRRRSEAVGGGGGGGGGGGIITLDHSGWPVPVPVLPLEDKVKKGYI